MTKIKTFTLCLLMSIPSFISAQQYSLNGIITDIDTNETLIGVTIGIKELPHSGAYSSANGKYNIQLPKGKYTLTVQYLGYENKQIGVVIQKNTTMDIALKSSSTELEEVLERTTMFQVLKPE